MSQLTREQRTRAARPRWQRRRARGSSKDDAAGGENGDGSLVLNIERRRFLIPSISFSWLSGISFRFVEGSNVWTISLNKYVFESNAKRSSPTALLLLQAGSARSALENRGALENGWGGH